MFRSVYAWVLLLCLAGIACNSQPITDVQGALDNDKVLRRQQIQLRAVDTGYILAIEMIDGDVKVRSLIQSGTDVLSPQFDLTLLHKAGGERVYEEINALRQELGNLKRHVSGRKIQLTAQTNTLLDQTQGFLAAGQKDKAFESCRQAADQGFTMALYYMGSFYQNGLEGVVKKDPAQAVEWYTRAAGRGVYEAMFNLGDMLLMGKEVPSDKAKAFAWFQKAAEMESSRAQVAMAYMIQNGFGTPKDPAKALEWINKAIAQNDPYAQNMMGDCYAQGKGVARDFAKAREWYEKAIAQDCVNAYGSMAWLLATCEDPKFQDGAAAVKYADKARELSTGKPEYAPYEASVMDNLAAAYARHGDYDKAITTQEAALGLFGKLEIAPDQDRDKELKKYQGRLELYRKHQAYVDHPEK